MSYAAAEAHFRRLGQLGHAGAILQWDEAVMMSPGGGEARASAVAALQVTAHELLTSPRTGELLEAARNDARNDELDGFRSASLREMERGYARATCLPPQLVEAMSKAQSASEQAWRSMRAENDWRGFVPLLQEVVALRREAAAALGQALGLSPYDALMDEFEPGARAERIDGVFAELKAFLPGFIDEVIEHQAGVEVLPLQGPFAVERQRALGRRLMQAVGFDTQRGRLDESHHPFCGGVPTDVRITTRYDEADFTSALMGVLHETGHAKYEQGLPTAWADLPIGAARGMAHHEGQSLLQEMQVSRSREFLTFAAPIIREELGIDVAEPAFSVDNLCLAYTRVERSLIRVDADEVTYPCHVILRYEIERPLIEGTMSVADIPEAWDAGMREVLQLSTDGDYRDGCMQDVHWPSGAFGYFPTYTLGAMVAAQLYDRAVTVHPEIPAEIAGGGFDGLNRFLADAIWSHGSRYDGDELLRRATGEPLEAAYLERHLRRRYLGT